MKNRFRFKARTEADEEAACNLLELYRYEDWNPVNSGFVWSLDQVKAIKARRIEQRTAQRINDCIRGAEDRRRKINRDYARQERQQKSQQPQA